MNVKEQIRKELLNQKEVERQQRIEENSKLTKITLYTRGEDDKIGKSYKEQYDKIGIKYTEKDLNTYPEISYTIGQPSSPVIEINGNYLVHGREFQSPMQSLGLIKFYASPDYIKPVFESKLDNDLKNIAHGLVKGMQQLQKQIAPVLKILNSLAEEENTDAKKNN